MAEDAVEDAKALLNVVRKFLNSPPTRQSLAELRQQLPNLVQALEPPRPSAADAERVRTRSTGVAAVDRLSEKDLTLARLLSDRLHINELLAARLVATQARAPVQTLVFRARLTLLCACGPAWGRLVAFGCRAAACRHQLLPRGGSPHTALQLKQHTLMFLPPSLCTGTFVSSASDTGAALGPSCCRA